MQHDGQAQAGSAETAMAETARQVLLLQAPMERNHQSTSRRRVTIEHLRRKCEGGTNHLDNLALACHTCNVRRGNRDWLTYASIKQGEVLV